MEKIPRQDQSVVDSNHKYKLMDWTHDKPNIEIQLTGKPHQTAEICCSHTQAF